MSVAPALNAAASPKNRKLLFEPSNLTDLPAPEVSSAVLIVPPVIVAPEVKFPVKFPEEAFISPETITSPPALKWKLEELISKFPFEPLTKF